MEQKFCFEFEPTKHSIGTASEIGRFYVDYHGLSVESLKTHFNDEAPTERYGIFDVKSEYGYCLLFSTEFENSDSFFEKFFNDYIIPSNHEKISVITNIIDTPDDVKTMLEKDRELEKAISTDKELQALRNDLYEKFSRRIAEILIEHGYIIEQN